MVLRIWIGSLVSALVLFVCRFVFWRLFCLADDALSELLGREVITDRGKEHMPEREIYHLPTRVRMSAPEEEQATFRDDHFERPVTMVFYPCDGANPAGGIKF